MARRKNTVVDILLDIFEAMFPLYVLYLISLWFTNKANFWRWVVYGVLYLFAVIAIVIWKKRKRFKMEGKWFSDRDLIQKLQGMKPWEFENYIADLFSKLGYKTEVTGGAYDEGVDVIAQKNGIKHYIQCKKFITQAVSVGAMRDFYGAIADHLANGKGYFITTNIFTLEAERFVEGKPIELIDGQKLIEYIRLAEKSKNKSDSKVCPKCGGKLEEKVGKYGKFLGCSNYPKCQYTENIQK